MISRLFAVLAAVLLVAAFSLFLLTPEDMSLVQGLSAADPGLPVHLKGFVRHLFGNGTWVRVAVPVLARPVWLLPLCGGLICTGLAASLATTADAGERFRRRS